jgi:hypothetical protein
METTTQKLTPATQAMLKLLVNSNNELIATKSRKILSGELSADEEIKYAGSFFKAVLKGDVEQAFQRADSENLQMLKQISAKIEVHIKQEIQLKDIANLLVSAFEGGSNYWYNIKEFIKPKYEDLLVIYSFNGEVEYYPKYISYPLSEGGSLIIEDLQNVMNLKSLNLPTIYSGIKVMAEKYPQHFNNFISGNDDAETGDVFLQCCLYGEIVFG